ncbi:MAG: diaminopimelate decarboxylase [Candidatus Omnitrophica bacterium CG11_big_fil_rev_8_21_14_0_20_64_10]|nr:MAG: diaminopimelate decarboxylase [Candidatus Omnitrophica bacterium CG11_big_fil_rev_8_21_14_0_20_64_10]
MSMFRQVRGQLHAEQVPVEKIARKVGTPFYLYSQTAIVNQLTALQSAFAPIRPLICYSVKANGNLAILKTLVRRGAGLDIVSGGELFRARRAGCPPQRIVFAGVGKSPEEIRSALKARIFCFNVESIPELEAIEREAERLKQRAPVALRVNPNIKADTHHYITTGTAENKFGIPLADAEKLILSGSWGQFHRIDLKGFHLHIGSQITQTAPFVAAVERIAPMIERLRGRGVLIDWLNLGGGLGITYQSEAPLNPRILAGKLIPVLKRLNVRLIFEPGRFLLGNAGILVTRILYVKETRTKRFAIVDAGMNDLIRPALYGAHHGIVPVRPALPAGQAGKSGAGARKLRYDVVGPVCESGDFFAKDRRLPKLAAGDLLAVLSVGAYGFTMASHYNARPNPPEVLVKGKRMAVIRKRERPADLIRGEQIPRL